MITCEDDLLMLGTTFDMHQRFFAESGEICFYPYAYRHPFEHYTGGVDTWFMKELTWGF